MLKRKPISLLPAPPKIEPKPAEPATSVQPSFSDAIAKQPELRSVAVAPTKPVLTPAKQESPATLPKKESTLGQSVPKKFSWSTLMGLVMLGGLWFFFPLIVNRLRPFLGVENLAGLPQVVLFVPLFLLTIVWLLLTPGQLLGKAIAAIFCSVLFFRRFLPFIEISSDEVLILGLMVLATLVWAIGFVALGYRVINRFDYKPTTASTLPKLRAAVIQVVVYFVFLSIGYLWQQSQNDPIVTIQSFALAPLAVSIHVACALSFVFVWLMVEVLFSSRFFVPLSLVTVMGYVTFNRSCDVYFLQIRDYITESVIPLTSEKVRVNWLYVLEKVEIVIGTHGHLWQMIYASFAIYLFLLLLLRIVGFMLQFKGGQAR